MKWIAVASTVLMLALALSGCNTTDALTPQADVGGGMQVASSPVTQSDTDRMAGVPAGQQPLAGQGYTTPPQNTLEAQAQALAAGSQPMQPPPPVGGVTTQQQPAAQASSPAPTQTAALAPAKGTIRFLPIIGAPIQAVTPLSRQLGAEARARGLVIKGSNDPAADHILKGYFSAFAEGGQVTIVYVWDVLNQSGSRLHRIQGQEVVPSSATEAWAGVPASLMQQIATKTINEYTSWLAAHGG
ncbi:hypothetical protein [Ciceribacter thiooxidans]|uniref:Lipoprotein n=1 Tax=Ciceribacter thiooxidans TaxID=1969821 RepID=A0ABV7I6L8_9HYPH|nr:hypothetical protein [Ciceribacter thiooxidans]